MKKEQEILLLKKFNKGDPQAFTEIYECHWASLFLYIKRMVEDENDAKDLVQETFLSFWNLKGKLDHIQSLPAYLLIMARNRTLRFLKNNLHKTDLLESYSQFLNHSESSITEKLFAKELSLVVDEAVDKLPERMKEAFNKSRVDGLSNKEIAAEMGVSDQTIKKQINKSIRFLRLRISNHYLFPFFLFFLK